MSGTLKQIGLGLILAAIYIALAYSNLRLFALWNKQSSPIWLASGFALFALYRYGPRHTVAILAGSFVTNYLISGQALSSAGIAAGNSLEALIAYRFASYILSRRDLGRLLSGAALGSVVAATNGALWIAGDFTAWLTWLIGDLAGITVIFPLLLSHFEPRVYSLRALAEVAVAGLATVPIFLFQSLSLAYLAVGPICYVSYKHGLQGATLSTFIVMVVVVVGHLLNVGPFALENILSSQIFVLFLSLLALGVHVEYRAIAKRSAPADG